MDALRVAAILVTLALSPAPARVAEAGPVAYSGTGAWIDRYDFAKLEDPEFAVAEKSWPAPATVSGRTTWAPGLVLIGVGTRSGSGTPTGVPRVLSSFRAWRRA
jgi:hypothetical protein